MCEPRPGVKAGDRYTPIPSVACYIPRGKGAFPSSVLMTAIPATMAGVKDICIITPPGPDGDIDDATLVAAELAGVSKVYKAGGAQGIAAVAYGTQTIAPVRKIVGPGSPWVAAAKRLVSDTVDVGTPAGPSETIVLADATTSGRLAALDLLIETEHGPDSSGYLVTWDEQVAQDALAAFDDFYQHMSPLRVDYAQTVLSGPLGGVVLARNEEDALSFINDYAPEHLQILSKDPNRFLDKIQHAGEILLGEYAPSTLANFVVGPSHVLPTGGWAQTGSALSVLDFMKRTSIVSISAEGYRTPGPPRQGLRRIRRLRRPRQRGERPAQTISGKLSWAMINIISVNIGKPQPIPSKGGTTGIFKTPQHGFVEVSEHGLIGDVIVDTQNHGGVDQAVYVYCQEDYDWWHDQEGLEIHAGLFGENLTIGGMTTSDAHIGARLVSTTIVLEITSPRQPCATLAARMNQKAFPKRFSSSRRTGFYCRVIRCGKVSAGQSMSLQNFEGVRISISDWIEREPLEKMELADREQFLRTPLHYKARQILSKH